MCDALIFSAGLQAVNAGKIHHENLAMMIQFYAPHAVFNRDTWEIRDLLA